MTAVIVGLLKDIEGYFYYHLKYLPFHPPAVRAATLGSWRMLTLGAEYEDTWWVPSPDKDRSPGQRAQEEPGPAEETADGGEEPSWRAAHFNTSQRYDTVLHLDGLSRAGRRDGVHHMVQKHERLHSTIWPCR